MTDLITLLADAAAKEQALFSTEPRHDEDGYIVGHELWRYHDDQYNDYDVLLSADWDACLAHLDRLIVCAQLRALQEAGYAVVPMEPTGDMLSAGLTARSQFGRAEIIEGYEAEIYRAMIAAATKRETP